MPVQRVTFAIVRDIGLKLPGVEEGTAYGSPALKSAGRMIACVATNKSADPNTLIVKMDPAQRDALIEEDPDRYYTREHYDGDPVVLVRLARVTSDALRDLLTGALRYVDEHERKKP